MKKKYKGYFKKPTNLSDSDFRKYIKLKREYSKDEQFWVGLWANLYLRDTNGKK